MQWYTETIYADLKTGQRLPPHEITSGKYLPVKNQFTTQIIDDNHGKRQCKWFCIRNPQLQIGF